MLYESSYVYVELETRKTLYLLFLPKQIFK